MVKTPFQTLQITSSMSNASVLFSQMNQKMLAGEHQIRAQQQLQRQQQEQQLREKLQRMKSEFDNEDEESEISDDDSDISTSSLKDNRNDPKKKSSLKKRNNVEKKSGGILKRKTCNRWTKKENDMLAKAIQLYGEKKWNDIAKYVGSKNSDQCSKSKLFV